MTDVLRSPRARAGRFARAALVASSLSSMAACDELMAFESGAGGGPAAEPAEAADLGTYHAVAIRSQTTCGDGLLATPAVWEFDVTMTKTGSELRWSFATNASAEAIGSFASDGVSFLVVAQSRFDLSSETCCGDCIVVRRDEAAGRLEATASAERPEAQGFLRYAFAAEPGSNCTTYATDSPDPNGAPIVPLPCEIQYAWTAEAKGVGGSN